MLRLSRLRMSQKIRIAFFLCLSCVMAIICCVRLVSSLTHRVNGKQQSSIAYTNLLLQVEAAVAVLMGSISALRAVFAGKNREFGNSGRYPFYQHLLSKLRLSRRSSEHSNLAEERPPVHQEDPPSITLRSLKKFIRRHGREPEQASIDSTVVGSIVDPAKDYHDFKCSESRLPRE